MQSVDLDHRMFIRQDKLVYVVYQRRVINR